MLTELGLVLSIDVLGLSLGGMFLREALRGGAPNNEARKLANAATRAAEAFLFRAGKRCVASLGAALLLVAAAHGASHFSRGFRYGLADSAWTAFAAMIGGALALLAPYLSTEVSLRAGLRGGRATRVSQDQALTLGVRSAGAVALIVEALGTAVVFGLLGFLYLLGGGASGSTPDAAVPLLERAARVLPGLGLGAVAVTLVLSRATATYRASSEAGALAAAGLDPWDARNPSMVTEVVGEHLGRGARRAADLVVQNLLSTTVLVLLGVAALRGRGDIAGTRSWALLSLPLVARGTGTLSAFFGILASRTREGERASNALVRGQLVSSVLLIGALGGAAVWLLGPSWSRFVGAGALGTVAALVVGQVALRRVDRRLSTVQETLDGARAGHPIPLLRGWAAGQEAALPVVTVLALAASGAYFLGERSGVPSGGLLGLAVALACLSAQSAPALAASIFAPIASFALASTALDADGPTPEARRRANLIDDAAYEGACGASAVLTTTSTVSALLAGLAAPLAAGATEAAGPVLSLSRLPLVWSGLLGAAFVALASGQALRHAARAGQVVLTEVDRQLRVFPRENGVLQVPETYTPSYRALVDLTGRAATENLVTPALAWLFLPVVLGILLRLLYIPPGLATEGLTSFVVIASATGLCAALTTDGSAAALGAAYRASRPRGSSPGLEASLSGHAFGSFAGETVAPAAHLIVTTIALVSLLVAPLLS